MGRGLPGHSMSKVGEPLHNPRLFRQYEAPVKRLPAHGRVQHTKFGCPVAEVARTCLPALGNLVGLT